MSLKTKMQYCNRTVALFILCIYLFILIDASHLLVTNDNNSKHQKKEIKVAYDNSKGIGKKLKQKHNLIRITLVDTNLYSLQL